MKRICALLALTGLVAAAGAQDVRAGELEGSAAGSEGAGRELELSGELAARWGFPAGERDYGGPEKGASISELFGLRIEAGDLKLVGEWEAAIGIAGADAGSGGSPVLGVEAGENAAYWSSGDIRLGLGAQYFSWGSADKQNPTDKLNARDYTAGLEPKKIPVFALSVSWYLSEGASLQAVVLPLPGSSVFPTDFAALVRSGVDSFNAAFNAMVGGASAAASVEARAVDPSPGSLVAGARLSFAAAGADFSLSYLYGWDEYYTPEFSLGSYAGLYYPSAVSLERTRAHRFGLDAKTAAGAIGLWAEAAFSLPEGYASGSYSLRRPSIEWTAGADLSFGPNDSFYANLQYLGQLAIDYDDSFASDYPGGMPLPARMTDEAYMRTFFERSMVQKLAGQSEGLLQGLSLNLKLPLRDAPVTPSLTALCLVPFLYDEAGGDRYLSLALKPEIEIVPVDSLRIAIGAELCYAWVEGSDGRPRLETESDRLGLKTKDNNVYVAARYSWNYRTAR